MMLRLSRNQNKANDMKQITVKIPHISKKQTVQFANIDTVKEFVRKAESQLGIVEVNYGLLVKDKGRKYYLDENELMIKIKANFNKVSLMKKRRVQFFETPDPKALKTLNSKGNQTEFLKLLIRNDYQHIVNNLKKGFDPNYMINGEPLLFHAISNDTGAPILTSLLISFDAHVTFVSPTRQTALHKAVRVNKPDIVRFLLQLGAAINDKDENGHTPLYFSILYPNNTICLDIMLSRGARIGFRNEKGLAEIHQACLLGKLDHLRMLIERGGADINMPTKVCEKTQSYRGYTPLHYAVYSRSWNIVQYLVSFAGRIDIRCRNHSGQSPLDLLTYHRNKGHYKHEDKHQMEIMRQLLTHGRVFGRAPSVNIRYLNMGIEEKDEFEYEDDDGDDNDDDDNDDDISTKTMCIPAETNINSQEIIEPSSITEDICVKIPSPESLEKPILKDNTDQTAKLKDTPQIDFPELKDSEPEIIIAVKKEEPVKDYVDVSVHKGDFPLVISPVKSIINIKPEKSVEFMPGSSRKSHKGLLKANKSPDKSRNASPKLVNFLGPSRWYARNYEVVDDQGQSKERTLARHSAYFGLETQTIEISRTREHGWGFGFKIESDRCKEDPYKIAAGDNRPLKFQPSPKKPSCHRLHQTSSITDADLLDKPYLLEVNGVRVNSMSHAELTSLINAIPGKLILLVTYHMGNRQSNQHSSVKALKHELSNKYTYSPSKASTQTKQSSYKSSVGTSLYGGLRGLREYTPNHSPGNIAATPYLRDHSSKSLTNVTQSSNKTPPMPILSSHVSAQKMKPPLGVNKELEEGSYCILDYDGSNDNYLPEFMNVEGRNTIRPTKYHNYVNTFPKYKGLEFLSPEESFDAQKMHRSGVILKLRRTPTYHRKRQYYPRPIRPKTSTAMHSSEINIPIIV